jgi:hypothetical protein
MIRRALGAFTLVVTLLTFGPAAAFAQTGDTTTTSTTTTTTTLLTVTDDALGRSLPKPNTGQKPQGFGDRGGAGQLILFSLISLFLLAVVIRIALATRKRTNSQKSVP